MSKSTEGYLWALEYEFDGETTAMNIVLDAFTLSDAIYTVTDLKKLGHLPPSTRVVGMLQEDENYPPDVSRGCMFTTLPEDDNA